MAAFYTSGLCIFTGDINVLGEYIPVIYNALFMFVNVYYLIRVGEKIKWFFEKRITCLRAIQPSSHSQGVGKLSAVLSSLLFLIIVQALCIPIQNLFITSLVCQEERIIEQISHQSLHEENITYLSNVDWFSFCFISTSCALVFLTSLSYFFATLFEILRHEIKQQMTDDNQNTLN